MDNFFRMEELLKKHKYNKARMIFLEYQLKRLTPETHEDYIMSKAYKPGHSETAPLFVMEAGEEIALLNKVEETAYKYKEKCSSDYNTVWSETQNEILQLKYYITIVEDGMGILERINTKYKTVIEMYYINSSRMEDIADCIHISRSRCYELCKEAVRWMARVVYGENSAVGT